MLSLDVRGEQVVHPLPSSSKSAFHHQLPSILIRVPTRSSSQEDQKQGQDKADQESVLSWELMEWLCKNA